MADYRWQIQAVTRFTKEVISAIVAACGTGKTRAGIRIAMAKMLPVIVIAPKNLGRQWRDDILEMAGDNQKIWLYDMVKEARDPKKYQDEFLGWLEPEKQELDAMRKAQERSDARG